MGEAVVMEAAPTFEDGVGTAGGIMNEEHLRDLLRRAVRDAPDIDPAVTRRRAASERRSRGPLAVAASVAAVLAVTAGALVAADLARDDGGDPSRGGVATRPSASDRPDMSVSPYDPEPCPERLPEGKAVNRVIRDLDGVVAVRLCPDLHPRDEPPAGRLLPDYLAQLEDADALVEDISGFAASLRDLPAGLPDYCTINEGPFADQAFAFDLADGTRTLVTAPGCETVAIEGHGVDSEAVRKLYLTALDEQRDRLDYTRPFDDELTCTSALRGGPIRPGRERLVAAVVCDPPPGAESIPMDLEPTGLGPEQLDELDRAWGRPGAPVVRGPSGKDECVDLADPPMYVMAATDRSDVVQLIDSPCGFLVWFGWEDHDGATLPTTVNDLH